MNWIDIKEYSRRVKELTFDLMIVVLMFSLAVAGVSIVGALIISIMKLGKDFCK